MSSVNKWLGVGNLGNDPEIRTFPNGGRVANLSVATSESWKDRETGERKERTEWHRVVVKNEGLVGICEKYLRKGAKIYLEGQLQTRKYEKNGVEHYTTEVIVGGFNGVITMLDSKGAQQEPSRDVNDDSGHLPCMDDDDMDSSIPF